jgi:hypothetical protein
VSSPSKSPKPPFVPPAHGLSQYAWLAEIGGALLVVLILTITESGGLFRDSGCLWHPVVGERILRDGFITTDPFSHTKENHFWIPFQWLAEVTMAKLYAWAEYDGLFWATVALFGSMFGWIVGRAVRMGCHPILAVLIGSLAFFECCHHFHARPHLATMAGICLLMATLTDVESGRVRRVALWWIVPLFCLWANVHGGVLGGWGTLGIVFFGWGVYFLLGKPSPIDSWKTVGVLLVLCVAATAVFLVNPYGWEYMKMWKIIMESDLPKIINEHAPLKLDSAVGIMVLGEMVLYVFILVGTFIPSAKTPLPGRERGTWWPRVVWLIPIVWFVLGWSRVRHAPLFSLVSIIAILDMLPHCRWPLWLAKRSDLYVTLKADDPKEPLWGVIAARLFPLLILFGPLVAGIRFVELDKKWWPMDLVPVLKEEAKKPGTKLFNEDRLAGLVIRYVPELKVFMDDRCELYQEPFLLDFMEAAKKEEGFANTAKWFGIWRERYGINLALTHPKSTFTAYLKSVPKEWELIGEVREEKDGEVKGGCVFRRKQ